jgi:hypothetical protein
VLAALLICSVIGISDGDTLSARCAIGGTPQTITVRLAGIDAPEKTQSFGARSIQAAVAHVGEAPYAEYQEPMSDSGARAALGWAAGALGLFAVGEEHDRSCSN